MKKRGSTTTLRVSKWIYEIVKRKPKVKLKRRRATLEEQFDSMAGGFKIRYKDRLKKPLDGSFTIEFEN